ncbi:hypothetical protein PISL3812_02187 [Talaromyces islandicus]|uniref:Ubiquitin-like protein smt3 n=1 Tax=Talaromyces islandicus TaxID=28573 RepID=A0A0U1LPH3_TALIS|nr:hypothetical protein PISL3812_02187 [Talaromyces islandicus]
MDDGVGPQASLEQSVEGLSIQDKRPDPDISRLAVKKPAAAKSTKKKAEVTDSWEDDLSDSGSATETETDEGTASSASTTAKIGICSPSSKAEGPLAPPPTPATDQGDFLPQWNNPSRAQGAAVAPPRGDSSRARPEKQTAVASRMIAGALGIRAPKRTEEQRAYDRAIKEKEMKRRNKAKEEAARAQEEEEKAKSAVWDD